MVAPTGFEPVFESRSRFRQVSYAVTDQQHPATSTRLKHAAESSLKHPEHDHVKREPGGPSPDERKLQNNGRRRGRRFAHPILAPARARGPRGDGHDPADLSGPRPSPARASRSTLSSPVAGRFSTRRSMTAPVEGCCHSAKNPRIGERVGVRGLFRVLDCCAGGLGSPGRGILGAKAPKKNSRTHGR